MNNRENLKKEIVEFIKSDNEKIMLITGTHQYEKHMYKMVLKFYLELMEKKILLIFFNIVLNQQN